MPRVRAGASGTVRHLRRPIRTREATATPPRSRPRSNAHAEADPARQLRRLHHTPPTRRAALRFLSRRSSTRLAGPQATAAQRMTVYFAEHDVLLHQGHVADVLPTLPPESVNCVVMSPPYYGLRDYGVDGQIGLEASPAEYVEALRAVFAEVRRVLRDDGTLWLNLGDSYAGSWGNQGHDPERDDLHVGVRGRGALPKGSHTGSRKPGEPGPKNLYGIPWRVAFALQDDGWTLCNDVIWSKPNAMPESVTD